MSKQATVFSHPLKPSEFHMAMELCMDTRKSLMVWGAPGIGKSMLTQQFADLYFPVANRNVDLLEQLRFEAADKDIPTVTAQTVADFEAKLLDQECNLVDFRLSQVDPTDLRGIPVPVTYYRDIDSGEFVADTLVVAGMNVEKVTETFWAPPGALNLPEDWKGIIFMDEVNGAMPIVQAACYQLFLDRKLGELTLPKDAMVMAAGNRENDGGVTFQLATPLKDRMIHVELTHDLKEWTENYAMNARVHPDILSYLQIRTADFNTLSPKNPNICGGSSPRSWVTASDTIYAFERRYGAGTTAQNRVLNAMMDGIVGDDIAVRVKTHREMTCKLPPVMDILTGKFKDVNKIDKMDISKNYAICSNLVYAMLDLTKEKTRNELDVEKYSGYAEHFLRFLDFNYGTRNTELAMMAIKSIFNAKIFFNPHQVPFYREFAQKHHELIIAARVI